MSVALFIVPERAIESFDHFVSGKSIGCESDRAIDKCCKEAGVKSLYEFCSHDPDEVASFLEAEGAEAPDELPELEWFEASAGLETVRGMLRYLEKRDSPFENTEGVIEDLKEYETVLHRLETDGIRWHMEVDF